MLVSPSYEFCRVKDHTAACRYENCGGGGGGGGGEAIFFVQSSWER